MGCKALLLIFLVLGALSAALLLYLFPELHTDVEPPELPDEYFGRGVVPSDPDKFPKDNPAIKKFEVHVDDAVLEDLKSRLANAKYVEPLDNVEFQYGFNANYLKEVVKYWQTKYDWRKQEKLLNGFSHYTTQIEGISVHFIHEKPKLQGKKVRVLPLLLIHGWPGSVVEFTRILPLLTKPRNDRNYVFEVICPSIPGYGFSEAPHQTGFNAASAARVFLKLMDRLGYKQFYVQGGDWGSLIATIMGQVYPKRIIGTHVNMLGPNLGLIGTAKYIVGAFFPSLFMSEKERTMTYPILNTFHFLLQETGYVHIQATKPETMGAALSDSPVGLAAYILEKFSTWTDRTNRDLKDGGTTKKFSLDDLLTNVMVYWVTNNIASSTRFYKENFGGSFRKYKFESVPLKVPTGVAVFPNELLYFPKCFYSQYVRNIVQFEHMPRGGHFAAMEEPDLLADEIWNFVVAVERQQQQQAKSEL